MNQQCNQWLYQQLPKGRISSKLFRLSDEWMYKTGLSGDLIFLHIDNNFSDGFL